MTAAPAEPARAPRLVQMEGEDAGRVIALTLDLARAGVWTVGRDVRCEVPLGRDRHVSRAHAQLRFREGRMEVVDLPASLNGTVVNGSLLEKGVPRALTDGDLVRFGETTFVFRDG